MDEIALLSNILKQGEGAFSQQLANNQAAVQSRRVSSKIHNPAVKARTAQLTPAAAKRQNVYKTRAASQRKKLKLPLFPTTTIGSFPQTTKIRSTRQEYQIQEK